MCGAVFRHVQDRLCNKCRFSRWIAKKVTLLCTCGKKIAHTTGLCGSCHEHAYLERLKRNPEKYASYVARRRAKSLAYWYKHHDELIEKQRARYHNLTREQQDARLARQRQCRQEQKERANPLSPIRVCPCGKSFSGKPSTCQACIAKRWKKKHPNARCIDCGKYPRPGTQRCRSCTIKHRARVKKPCKCGLPHFVKKLCRTCYKREWINRTPLTREYELKKKREDAKRRYKARQSIAA